jgi:uroporphyrinogen decarboxylase
VPYHDTYWVTTVERWRREGLPEGVSAEDFFGCEIVRLGGDYSLQLPVETLEESEGYRIYLDENGATRKDLATADGWTPGWLDFTIKGPDDWVRLRDRAAYNPSRIPGSVQDGYRQARKDGKFVVFSLHACFHPTWHKIGMDALLVWMLDHPDLITEMFAAHTQLVIDMYEGMVDLGLEFDGAWLSDDLGYRNAPLISPDMYRDLVLPHHQRLCSRFAQDGLKTMLHSDGNVGPLIPHFLDAGFAALHPLEAKAGLDVRDLKPRYGDRLVLFGNIDVRRLASTRDAIEEEIRAKVTAAKEGGGYIYHSDHSVPKDVSFDNYRFLVEMLEKYGRYD